MTSSGLSPESHAIRRLIRAARWASLATLEAEDGFPYVSRVAVASDGDGAPLFLASGLARHSRNLLADARASLLLAAEAPPGSDPLAAARVSVIGTARQLDGEHGAWAFRAWHSEAEAYAAMADFALWRLEPRRVHLVAGFGHIRTLEAESVFLDRAALERFAMLAEKLRGGSSEPWRALDPDGAILHDAGGPARRDFPEPLLAEAALLGARRVLES